MTTSSTAPHLVAAHRLAQQFNWRLLPADAWAAAAGQVDPAPADEKAARRACLTVYSQLLFEACQDGDLARRKQAYGELHVYLWWQAYYKEAELACDAADGAIRLIERSFQEPVLQKCRNPVTFLAFAHGKLCDALTRVRRQRAQRQRREVSLDEKPGEDDDGPDDRHEQIPAPGPSPLEELIEEETKTERLKWLRTAIEEAADRVLRCLGRLWQKSRLRRQLRAVIITYMDMVDDDAIAARLKTQPANVEVLRSRGLDHMAACLRGRSGRDAQPPCGIGVGGGW